MHLCMSYYSSFHWLFLFSGSALAFHIGLCLCIMLLKLPIMLKSCSRNQPLNPINSLFPFSYPTLIINS